MLAKACTLALSSGRQTTPFQYRNVSSELPIIGSQDLTAGSNGSDTAPESVENVGGNYNLPGGAQGSLITNSFSLAGSGYADKPTLYFTYHLETEDFAELVNQALGIVLECPQQLTGG